MTTTKDQGKLQEAIKILKAAGMRPINYKHLTYEEVVKLAGLKL